MAAKPEVNRDDLPNNLDDIIRPVPLVEEKLFQVPVSASGMLKELARSLFQAIDQMAVKELPVTAGDFVDAFEYILALRCAYVSGVCKGDVHPKEVEYPSMLFPVLAQVGRYLDTHSNTVILPIPEIGYQGVLVGTDDLDDNGLPKFKISKGKVITAPEKFRQVLTIIRSYGVNTAHGLPMDKDIDNDDVYRLTVAEGAILGHRKEPSSHTLYARALLEMQYLAVLYGEARVQYLAVASLRSGIDDLVARHVRGPSRRTD